MGCSASFIKKLSNNFVLNSSSSVDVDKFSLSICSAFKKIMSCNHLLKWSNVLSDVDENVVSIRLLANSLIFTCRFFISVMIFQGLSQISAKKVKFVVCITKSVCNHLDMYIYTILLKTFMYCKSNLKFQCEPMIIQNRSHSFFLTFCSLHDICFQFGNSNRIFAFKRQQNLFCLESTQENYSTVGWALTKTVFFWKCELLFFFGKKC